MRRLSPLLASVLLAGSVIAQAGPPGPGRVSQRIAALHAAGRSFTAVPLMQAVPSTAAVAPAWNTELEQGTVLQLDASRTTALLADRPETFTLSLPSEEGDLLLDLERVDITTEDFSVVAAGTNTAVNVPVGVHYRGCVRGEERSLAAISVFGDEVMGLITDASGDRVLGRLHGAAPGTHILYRTADVEQPPAFHCDTPDDGQGYTTAELSTASTIPVPKCVRFYWEVNYNIYQDKGSVPAATNYVTGLFNQSAALFANDGITVRLSEVFVWDVPSPYTGTTTEVLLAQFGAYRTSFNGDFAHLLGYGGGGGRAWINTLCNSQARLRMAYSGISSSYQVIPAYSWSVNVVTHEQGHLLGSRHTHDCVWNGNNTAIDGCGPAAGYPTSPCPPGPIPPASEGGTIMSYCHLLSNVGINLANGFGEQPRNVILNRIGAATCLSSCNAATCGVAPLGLHADVSVTGAVLSWHELSDGSPHAFTLQWKRVADSTWTTVTGLVTSSYTLANLQPGTAYHFRVKADCSAASSPYTGPFAFTTLPDPCGGPPDGLSVTDISADGKAILHWNMTTWSSFNTTVTLEWGIYPTHTWNVVTGLTTDHYQLTGLQPGVLYGFRLRRECTAGASTFSPVVTFYGGYPCGGAVQRYGVDGITSTSADLHWREGSTTAPITFTLQWRRASTLLWNTITGLTAHDYTLSGLTPCTSYVFRVRVECALGPSAYIDPVPFTTLGFNCSVSALAIGGGGDVEGLDERSLQLHPNPAGDQVNVIVPASPEASTVELLDAVGRIVYRIMQPSSLAPVAVRLDVGDRPAGIYLVRLTQGEAERQQRLVVSR